MSYKDKIDNIEAVCLFPKDFEASRRFYEDVFGFRPKRIQNDGVDPTVENPNFIDRAKILRKPCGRAMPWPTSWARTI